MLAASAVREVTGGDTLPNALAALARTRERTLVEIDEHLAAKEREDDDVDHEALRARTRSGSR